MVASIVDPLLPRHAIFPTQRERGRGKIAWQAKRVSAREAIKMAAELFKMNFQNSNMSFLEWKQAFLEQ